MLQLLDVKPLPRFQAFYICDNSAVIAASSTACEILEIVTTFDGSVIIPFVPCTAAGRVIIPTYLRTAISQKR